MAVRKTGYSLAEVIIVVLILGALTFIAVPRLDFAAVRSRQAWTVAKTLATDLRRTRTLAIVNAANNTRGYCLQMVGSPHYTSYQITDVNSGSVIDTQTIDSHITCDGGSLFYFGHLGNLLLPDSSTDPITVSSESKTYTITVVSATGIVKCTN